MDEKFSKELESKNTHMEILEMKTWINQIKYQ
jgi:hypothetical protein